MVAVPTLVPNPKTTATIPAATTARASAGTVPWAIWKRCHQFKPAGGLRSAPGSRTAYGVATTDGAGAGPGDVPRRICSARAASVTSSCSSAAVRSPLHASPGTVTQPSITFNHSAMLSAVAGGSANAPQDSAHEPIATRALSDGSTV